MVVAAGTVAWHRVLVGWQTDPVAIAGVALEALAAFAYLIAVARAARRRPWPLPRTAAFLGGLGLLAVVLQSGLAAYDDGVAWVHSLQHVLVMSIVPPLLALGAPMTLCLQALPTRAARKVVAVLHHRGVDAVCGRVGAVHLPIDYYGVMAVYLFTPAYALSQSNTAFHVGTHVVFLTCGLLFWVPMVGVDPTGWRPQRRTRLLLVAVGLPVNAAIAAADGNWSLLVASEIATLAGIALVAARPRRATVRMRVRPTPAVVRP